MTGGPPTCRREGGKERGRGCCCAAMPCRPSAGPRRERGEGEKGRAAPAGWAGPSRGEGGREEVRGGPRVGPGRPIWERVHRRCFVFYNSQQIRECNNTNILIGMVYYILSSILNIIYMIS
jgi:hypothetical protein